YRGRLATVEQGGGDAGRSRLRRSLQLGAHATGAGRATAVAGHRHDLGGQRGDVRDRRGRRVTPRVGAVQRVDVGGDQQQVGIDQRGHDGGEVVVVAELQLVHRDGVVL